MDLRLGLCERSRPGRQPAVWPAAVGSLAQVGGILAHRIRIAVVVVASSVVALLGGGVAGGATPVAITAPADGSSETVGYAGPVSVDLSGGDLGSYVVSVTGPGGYAWQATVDYDGSQPTRSWAITPLSVPGSYGVSVQAPDSTIAASASFSVPPDAATVLSPVSGSRFQAPYSGPVRVSWDSVSDPTATYAVEAFRGGSLWATLCSGTGSGLVGTTTSCSHSFPAGSSYEIRLVNVSTGVTFAQGTAFGVDQRPLTVRASASRRAFYPLERDGYRDSIRVYARPNMSARLSVLVKGRLGRVVRRGRVGLVHGGRRVTWRWAGGRSSGGRVGPGRYTLYAVARGHGQTVSSNVLHVAVRRLPLRVGITADRLAFTAPRHHVVIRFRANLRARAVIRVVSGRGRAVRTVALGRVRGKRWHGWSWNGTDGHGHVVRAGRYSIRVTASRPGQRVTTRAIGVRVRHAGGGGGGGGGGGHCAASYPTVCIPPPPPDLDCGDIPYRNFRVRWDVPHPDPHHFDGDGDGVGCQG